MSDDEFTLDETVQLVLTQTAKLLDRDAEARIEPTVGATVDPERQALEALSEEGAAGPLRIDLGRTIGAGGMGVVRLGRQRALHRDVAVKTLLDDPDLPKHARREVLQEAWVTGSLEHPNIVPIHDLALDEAGRPVIVMKHIEGRAWRSLIAHPAALAELGVGDPLGWHLRTLIQVCRALEYAHSRQIIHRDVKPDNVMIGAFGEVYLLDWGIAVALTDDGSGRFPVAGPRADLAGTPAYMAPEMLGDTQEPLDVRADVYLLGATLYQVLHRDPPHLAKTQEEVIRSVLRSDPTFAADAPPELVAICRRAMAPRREDRYPTVAAFRAAVEAFVEHRASAALATEAREGLGALRAAVEGDDRHRIYACLGACRFGFQQALRDWPDNEAARAGLREAIEAVAAWELSRGDDRAAEALLADLIDPDPALVSRLASAREARLADAAEADALRRSADASVGARGRAAVLLPAALVGLTVPLYDLYRMATGAVVATHAHNLTRVCFMSTVLATALWWFRRRAPRTQVNQLMFAALASLGAIILLTAIMAAAAGLDPRYGPVMMLPYPTLTFAILSGATPMRLWFGVGALAIAYVLSMLQPSLFFVSMGPAVLILLLNAASEARRLGGSGSVRAG